MSHDICPDTGNLALATGPNPVPAVAVAADILRKRKRPPRRIVMHTAKARPVMLSTMNVRSSFRSIAPSM